MNLLEIGSKNESDPEETDTLIEQGFEILRQAALEIPDTEALTYSQGKSLSIMAMRKSSIFLFVSLLFNFWIHVLRMPKPDRCINTSTSYDPGPASRFFFNTLSI